MRMLHRISWKLLLPLLVFGTSCKDGTSPPVPTTITISGPTFSFTALGQTAQYSGQVLDQKGRAMTDVTISWSSSAPGVLEINPTTGLATARGNGTAVIRASAGSASGTRDVTVAQVPQEFSKVAGDKQTGTVGTVLPQELRVRVEDSGGSPIPGAQVAFSVSGGGGSISASTRTTDQGGEASVAWTLGTVASENQEVTATVAAFSVVFSADAEAGPPESLSLTAGAGQTGYAMEPLPTLLEVLVEDLFGNPTRDVGVLWDVTGGGGSLTAESRVTNVAGKASASWVLGPSAGENTASASVKGVGTVLFSATGLPNAIISGAATLTYGYLAPPQPEGATPEPAPPRAATRAGSVPGELLVVFEPGPFGAPSLGAARYQSAALARDLSREMSVSLEGSVAADLFEVESISPAGMAAKIQVAEGADPEAVAATLRRDPRIRAVEPNYLVYRPPFPDEEGLSDSQLAVSSEPGYPLQAWHYEMIQLPEAWEVTTGSSNVTVAVVDDGIRFDHWDLTANLTDDGYDFVEEFDIPRCSYGSVGFSGDGDGPDPDPTTPAAYLFDPDLLCVSGDTRYGGHGTHVAGTIGAVGNNGGVTGINWNVRIRPVRVLGTIGRGTAWSISQGILYAAGLPAAVDDTLTVQAQYGAHVINLSLGSADQSEVEANAVAAAAAAGSLVVAAAGNDATSVPSYPAAFPEALAVSAVNPWFEPSAFSNFGSWIDIEAPGGQGGGRESADVYSTRWDFQEMDPSWGFSFGTSMAAPHVSGVAALLFAQNSGISAAEVRQRLLQYARRWAIPTYYGAGLLDAFSSLREGHAFEQDFYVRLVDASSGAEVRTDPAGPGGSFRFSHLDDGPYLVFAGVDDRGDEEIGCPGRYWGAYGGTASPVRIEVSGGGVYDASFSFGEPLEQENNGSSALATYLALDGYMNGILGTVSDEDWYLVQVPKAGTYTFTTHGWWGACGLAANANTALEVYTAGGAFLGGSDDRNAGGLDYCASLSMSLSPGTHYVRVRGSSSVPFRALDQAAGWYRVSAKRGM